MGYGEVGTLLPGASSYRGPSGQVRIDEASGRQKVSYLSQMDQFYAQLAESTRQFDKSFGLQERQVTLAEESDEWRKEFSYAQLEQQGELGSRELGIRSQGQSDQLSLGRQQLSAESDYRGGMLDLAEREFGLKEEAFGRESAFEDIYAPQFAEEGLRRSRAEGSSAGVPEGTLYGSSGVIYDSSAYRDSAPDLDPELFNF